MMPAGANGLLLQCKDEKSHVRSGIKFCQPGHMGSGY